MQWLVLSRVSLQGLRVELSQLTCPNEPASHFPRLSSFLAESGQARNTCSRPPGGSTATYCLIRVAQAPGRCKRSSDAKPLVSRAEKKIPSRRQKSPRPACGNPFLSVGKCLAPHPGQQRLPGCLQPRRSPA